MPPADLLLSGMLLASRAEAGCDKCEGEDRQRIVEALWALQADAYEDRFDDACDISSLLGCIEQSSDNAQKRRDAMSAAGLELYDGYLKNLSVRSRGSHSYETMCSGDMCCDGTGCYGGQMGERPSSPRSS